MYTATLEAIGTAAAKKAWLIRSRPGAYLVHAAMAGAYVGLGIILIFSLGTPLAAVGSPTTGLVMAATFGIALSLVIVAGADLFTGNTMVMPVGALTGRSSWSDLARVWAGSYVGNLLGSLLVAVLVWQASTFTDPSWVLTVAAKKMSASWGTLFFRAILCNWLVVLAIWSSYRLTSETAKLAMTWWCLLAFIGSGYEHSVANMTLLTLANLLPHGPEISWAGLAHNLIPVTLGNIFSGAILMGVAYIQVSPVHKRADPLEEAAASAIHGPTDR